MRDEQSSYYESVYFDTHYKGILGRFTSKYHRDLEKSRHIDKWHSFAKVLEVGAGEGEHISFVRHPYDMYVLSDLQQRNLPPYPKTNFVVCNVEALPFATDHFDRVIATCVLHHVERPSVALEEIRRVTKSGGLVSLYLPCDPGFIYRLVRHLASHKKQSKISNISIQEVKHLWALEHKNHVLGLKYLIQRTFQHDRISLRRFPFFSLSWNFNLYFIYQITIEK